MPALSTTTDENGPTRCPIVTTPSPLAASAATSSVRSGTSANTMPSTRRSSEADAVTASVRERAAGRHSTRRS